MLRGSKILAHANTDTDYQIAVDVAVALDEPWHVILFNDHVHSFDDVVLQVMKATGRDVSEAADLTLEAHNNGQASVHSGEFEGCFSVQTVLREIALQTEIRG
ncbi:MAG: ATP-dependent Clp protease adaptor protein ClpS [Thalassolituus oleivorans]|jgi:ATP-dependent Clp protease adaptor protein ClpS